MVGLLLGCVGSYEFVIDFDTMAAIMTTSQPTFLILDGNALLHRAWHAVPPLTTADGRVVNAVYGFAMIIEKMRSELKPDFMAVAWDLPGGTFRHEEYEAYKAKREKKSQELYDQIPMIQELLKCYRIPSLSVPGFEGDDILGTVSAMNERDGLKTLILTGDLDALQLVTPMTEVVFFVKGLSQTKRYTVEAVKERYGLLPSQLIDYKTLVGDASDNLPGIQGIGEKTAVTLLQEYKTVEGIFAAIKDGIVPEKFAKKFKGQEKTAEQMKRLVTIVRDMPLKEFDRGASTVREPELDKLIPMLQDFEFKSLLKRYEGAGDRAPGIEADRSEKTVADDSKSSASKALDAGAPVQSTANRFEKKRHASLPSIKLADLETDRIGIVVATKAQDLFGGAISCIVLTDGRGIVVFDDPSKSDVNSVIRCLASAKLLVAHNAKELLHLLDGLSADTASLLSVPMFDTQVAAYLLASSTRDFAYIDVVRNQLGVALAADASATEMIGALLPLATMLDRKLENEGMKKLAEEIEMPLIPVLFTMEKNGFAVDKDKLASLSKLFDERLQILTKEIYGDAGKEFNINSPSQLADVLFVDLAIATKGIKKTKSGFSTAAPELEKLSDVHPIADKISEYRELAKLKGTYADSLPKLIAADGRIHARFNQCVAATGRLSGADPNLQNIPIRSDLGREIRKAFIAPKGRVLLSADYSQIELRLAAHIAKDDSFIRAFRDGADIHKRTAAEMWGIDESEVTKEQRYAAKAINFGILYGIGARALGKSAGVRFEEAKDFIERYFVAHPGIAAYLDATKLQAHADGYVASLYGRRRYFPEINSGMPQLIAAAERMAINMPIQATQADIIKMAMNEIAAWLKESKIDAMMIAQVHDELVFEVAETDAEKLSTGVRERMGSITQLDVPLVVDVAVSKSWGDME